MRRLVFLTAGSRVGPRARISRKRLPGNLTRHRRLPSLSRRKSWRTPANPNNIKEAIARDTQDRVKALLRDYQSARDAFRKASASAKNIEERKSLQRSHPGANDAFYAGALLQEAETAPGTPAALEALIWIADHLVYGSMPERAKEMLARHHARSDKIEPLFSQRQVIMAGSKPTERLFRAVLAQNANRKIQGLACYYLALYLDYQASMVRLYRLFDPAQLENATPSLFTAGWGQDYNERLVKIDPEALEREAALLYGRVIQEFADLPLNRNENRMLPGRPTNTGGAARIYLDELERLSVGRPAPEIDGIDLDGKPMKLSDYRGKVVALYFGDVRGFSSRSPILAPLREVAKAHKSEPFVLLGVATANPFAAPAVPNADRDASRKALAASGLPARFWFDPDQNGKPGKIQTAWNASGALYVLDHHGVIRHKLVFRREFFENAVSRLLKELADEPTRKNERPIPK